MPKESVPIPSITNKNSITYETGTITANGGVKVRCGEGTGAEQIGSIAQSATVKVIARGANEVNGYYWDLVISDSTGIYGYVARNYISTTGSGSNSGANSDSEYSEDTSNSRNQNTTTPATNTEDTEGSKMKISGGALLLSAGCTLDDLKKDYPYIVILDTSGAVTARLGTGYMVLINGGSYKLVKKGDVNGDGEIDVSDVILMLNHIKKKNIITDDAKLEAASISGETEITVTDVVKELNYIKKTLKDIFIK